MSEYLKSDLFIGTLNQLSTGSIQKNFGPTHLDQMSLITPGHNGFKSFNRRVEAHTKKIISNKEENQKLAEIRDRLLPMFLNVQITVK